VIGYSGFLDPSERRTVAAWLGSAALLPSDISPLQAHSTRSGFDFSIFAVPAAPEFAKLCS